MTEQLPGMENERRKRLAICSSRPKYGEKGGATAMCTIDVVRRPEGQPKSGRVAASGVEIDWWE